MTTCLILKHAQGAAPENRQQGLCLQRSKMGLVAASRVILLTTAVGEQHMAKESMQAARPRMQLSQQ
jgi:hypothetical protein